MAKREETDPGTLIEDYSKQFPMIHDTFIPTRYLSWDYVLGGGLPVPRIISLTSESGVGKTHAVLCFAASVLDADKENIVVYLDNERGLSSNLLDAIFGQGWEDKYKNRFVILSLKSYEEAEEVINSFARTGKLKLVVFDSLTFLQPAGDLEKAEAGETTRVGGKAGAESKFCPRMKAITTAANFSIIYINQRRANFGGTSWSGPATKMAASQSVMFYSDYIINMKNMGAEKNVKGEKIGATIQIVCEKNRIVGNKIAYAFFRYGYGISNSRTIAEFFRFAGIIKQAGAFFTFVDEGVDFGAGVGQPVKVQGLKKCEELVGEKLGEIIKFYTDNGKLKDFFDNYSFK